MTVKTFFSKLGKPGIVFLSFLTICILVILFIIVRGIVLRSQPVQTAHVQVLDKYYSKHKTRNGYSSQCSITFIFPDGNVRKIHVEKSVYDTLQIGDTGMLSYKALCPDSILGSTQFISFEKDASGP